MNYQNLVNLIRNTANLVNPTGHFVHGRNTDGSLDYDYSFPQIHLLPVETSYDVDDNIKTHSLILMFWEQDSPESSNDERELKIAAMDLLSDNFLAALNSISIINVSDVLKTPEYRQLAGTASGYGLSFSLITKEDCDEEPIFACPNASYNLLCGDEIVSNGQIPSGQLSDIPIDGLCGGVADSVPIIINDLFLKDEVPCGNSLDITIVDQNNYEIPVDFFNLITNTSPATLLMQISCGLTPIPCTSINISFNADVTNAPAGTTITFTDTTTISNPSVAPTLRVWRIKSGLSIIYFQDSNASLSYQFLNPGLYEIQLISLNENLNVGDILAKKNYITIT